MSISTVEGRFKHMLFVVVMTFLPSFQVLNAASGVQARQPGYLKISAKPFLHTLEDLTHVVYDLSHALHEEPAVGYPQLKVVRAKDIFKDGTVFFGFGLPNVYMARINSEGQVLKVDAKSLRREPMKVVDTHGKIQSGLFIVPKFTEPSEIEEIAALARQNQERSDLTCVQTNASILSQAGFTINGVDIGTYYWPDRLLTDLLRYGLERNGKAIEFDIVKTTQGSLEAIVNDIKSAIRQTPLRHALRIFDSSAAKKARFEEAKRIKELNDKLLAEYALNGDSHDPSKVFELELSQSSSFGSFLRRIWGAHVLYKIKLPADFDIDSYLGDKLVAFPQANPSWMTWVKKNYIFSPAVVSYLFKHMAFDFKPAGHVSEFFLKELLPVRSDASLVNKYNIVITSKAIFIAKLNVYSSVADWTLSKHVLIANYSDDVRFAGELWKDSQGHVRINNNSGSYQPSPAQLEAVTRLAAQLFPNLHVAAGEEVDFAQPVAAVPASSEQP